MNIHHSLCGLVLAGGRSSRMGENKAYLKWNGVPLYQHMMSLLDQIGMFRIMVSGEGYGCHSIPDELPGRGPLSGIHAALSKLDDGYCLLVVPVDMPLLPVEALEILAQQQQPCCFDGYTLPMLLPVTPQLRQWVIDSINSQQPRNYSLWRLHRHLQGVTIALPGHLVSGFCNANTPEDWQQCQIQEQP